MIDVTGYGFEVVGRAPSLEGMILSDALNKAVGKALGGWPEHWEIGGLDAGIYTYSYYSIDQDLEISVAFHVTASHFKFVLDFCKNPAVVDNVIIKHEVAHSLHDIDEDMLVPGGLDRTIAAVMKAGLKKAKDALKRKNDEVSAQILKEMETWK